MKTTYYSFLIRAAVGISLPAALLSSLFFTSCRQKEDTHYYIDVHHLGPGKVTAQAVAEAHRKDLEVEDKYHTQFINYWVDEKEGVVYCLSRTSDPDMITKTHEEAHGLIPDQILSVTAGEAAKYLGSKKLFLDIHELGRGNVAAEDVAKVHLKDLEVQKEYGVNFINYWVDENTGTVFCLSEAPDSNSVIQTHKKAHGLVPVSVEEVIQGE